MFPDSTACFGITPFCGEVIFFQIPKVSSSIVIKVDFDLTMSILAHNILRLLAMDLPGYSHDADYTLYKKFLSMTGNVKIGIDEIAIYSKKKETFMLC